MQVKVRALIWCDTRRLVHEEHRQGTPGHAVHDVNLVFDAELLDTLPPKSRLVDPAGASDRVVAPILRDVAEDREGPGAAPRWLGNVWQSTS